MREDTIVEQDTTKEIIHEDVEILRRFGAASLTVVFEMPLSDVTVVDGEKAVLDCRVAVMPAADVTGYVDTSFTVRGLRAGTGYYFRVVAENGASQPLTLDHSFVPRTLCDRPSAPRGPLEVSDVTRSSVTLSWLAPTSNGGATTNSASASRRSRSARPTAIRSFSRPTADSYGDNQDSTSPVVRSLFRHARSDIFVSFRHRTLNDQNR